LAAGSRQQAAVEGISVFVAAGDSGAAGCDSPTAIKGTKRAINGLCSSPYATCVGGTQFHEGSNPGLYWLPGNNPALGIARGYIPEVVWNESGGNGGSGLAAGGGGASIQWPKPFWQVGTGVPTDGYRDVPDVSLTASSHDGYFILFNGVLSLVGGTSAAAPSLAGMFAILNQKYNRLQGSVNPALYPLAVKQMQGGAVVGH
jgi:pseudomonalisin